MLYKFGGMVMIKECFSFLSNDGRTTIHAVKWIPDSGEYNAVMQISHGMTEYIERYEAFAEFFEDFVFPISGLNVIEEIELEKDFAEDLGIIFESAVLSRKNKLVSRSYGKRENMIYAGIAAGIFLLELFLKGYIEKNKTEGTIEEKCGGILWIRKYHNKGAFLNLMEKHRPVVAGISIIFSIVLTVMFVLTLGKKGKAPLKTVCNTRK